jgi:diguanylate cyclase (GGDEF)-like protein
MTPPATMSANPEAQQVFSWTLQLSAQKDYQALTHHFLEMLLKMAGIQQAVAYEMHSLNNKRVGDASTAQEQLVIRFPLDFTKEACHRHNTLLDKLDTTTDQHTGLADENGYYAWTILSVRGSHGPDRALLIEGHFSKIIVDLLSSLREFYRNLVILHDAKERDVLTRLPNRQSLESRLLSVWEHYSQNPVVDKLQEKSSWIAILDIDHFKRINDNFGHLYGDEVLLIFSQIMSKTFRHNDFLFRYGGEEFIVILNLATQIGAEIAFNRFRNAIAEYNFPKVGKVTVSIGTTHINSQFMQTTLLDHADKALYHAKETGRNKIVVYEDIKEHTSENEESPIEFF